MSLYQKRKAVDTEYPGLSVADQCSILQIHRSGLYYCPKPESPLDLHLMKLIDQELFDKPFYGVKRMAHHLGLSGFKVNEKRIRRLYRLMGVQVIYLKKNTSRPDKAHYKYPYLLKGLQITKPGQVWAADITWIPMQRGFMYLFAIIDLYSRYVVGWSISNSMDAEWCTEVLQKAIDKHGTPEIFNTDQGSQFTSMVFTGALKSNNIRISMDGKGRAIDNVFIERLWRSVKYEHVYINPANGGLELYRGLSKYMDFYNNERIHQNLDYQTPKQVFFKKNCAA